MDYGQIRIDPDDAERIWRLAVATELRADDEQLALLRLAPQLEWTSPQHAGLVAEAEKTRKVRTLTTTDGTTQGWPLGAYVGSSASCAAWLVSGSSTALPCGAGSRSVTPCASGA